MGLNPSLLAKLSSEETRFQELLGKAQSPEDLSVESQDYAKSRLLALTPLAFDAVQEVLEDVDHKDRLKAADMIFTRSPATQALGPQASVPSLPVEAFKLLIEGMGRLFTGLPQMPVLKAAPDQELTHEL